MDCKAFQQKMMLKRHEKKVNLVFLITKDLLIINLNSLIWKKVFIIQKKII